MEDRFALLLEIWALPPRHTIMRFLTGSSEVLPLSPDEEQAELCAALRKARTLIHDLDEKIDVLEGTVSDLEEEIEDLGG